jgi:hypothetical protein
MQVLIHRWRKWWWLCGTIASCSWKIALSNGVTVHFLSVAVSMELNRRHYFWSKLIHICYMDCCLGPHNLNGFHILRKKPPVRRTRRFHVWLRRYEMSAYILSDGNNISYTRTDCSSWKQCEKQLQFYCTCMIVAKQIMVFTVFVQYYIDIFICSSIKYNKQFIPFLQPILCVHILYLFRHNMFRLQGAIFRWQNRYNIRTQRIGREKGINCLLYFIDDI